MKNLRLSIADSLPVKRLMVLVIATLGISLLSCTHNPPANGKLSNVQTGASGKGQKVEKAPQQGDVKLVDGVEYIYARNLKFNSAPYEPEFEWVRKDHYSPGLSEKLGKESGEKDNLAALRKRIEKLEEELRKQENPKGGPR